MKFFPSWPRVRKFFTDVHLWLGLSSGLVVVAICFSGTIYVWNTELSEWSAPHLFKTLQPAGGQRIAADSLFDQVEKASKASIVSVMIPGDGDRSYQYNTRAKSDKGRGGTTYYVDPYTGRIQGNSKEKTGTQKFMASMFSLHRWLYLDKIDKREIGSAITGIATIIFTLGCLTGLIIWFPRNIRTWKQGLKIKTSGNWKRTNHDLHNSLAFYSLIFLLLMGITGPFFSFTWYREGLQKTLGTYKPQQPRGGERATKPPTIADTAQRSQTPATGKDSVSAVELLPLRQYLAAADKVLPYKGDYTITLPGENPSTLAISKTRRGFFAPAAPDRLTIDVSTADIKKKEIFKEKPFNERVSGSIKALHVGNVYGTFTKLIYFLACLIATSLPITGTLIWWNKLKKKRKRRSGTAINYSVDPAGV